MASDVVLSAAMRNNLLSLQSTQKKIDVAQYNLSTGKKVNSALDNPQSFFAAQSLNNRANDLNRLLDGIGQSIQVVKAADNGITALTRLVEQADSIATQARDALAAGQQDAAITGTVDLRGATDLTNFGTSGIAAGQGLTITVMPNDGTAAITETINVTAGMSAAAFAQAITDTFANDQDGQVIASLTSEGKLDIRTANGETMRITTDLGGATVAGNKTAINALGLTKSFAEERDGTVAGSRIAATTVSTSSLQSNALTLTSDGSIADRSTLLSALTGFTGVAGSTITVSTDKGASATFTYATSSSIQSLVDTINNSASLGPQVRANFDEDTGRISLTAMSSEVSQINITTGGVAASTFPLGFGTGINDVATTANPLTETINIARASGNLRELEVEFGNVMKQIDQLVTDTGYRGTNLLNGDDLLTVFNEDRSSSLTTEGVTFTAVGLGMSEDVDFSRAASVDAVLEDVRGALANVRNFGSTLANDLAVIQARQDYTGTLINTLNEGADLLTLADQNEEGAKLLALQTRQSLGVTALSLASQAQQSILRLF